MKRARKGRASATGFMKRKAGKGERAQGTRVREEGASAYKVNAEEEKELRMKYFGETAEEAEEEIAVAAAAETEKSVEGEESEIPGADVEPAAEESALEEMTAEEVPEPENGEENPADTPAEVITAENSKGKVKGKGKKVFSKKYAVIFSVSLAVIIFASVFALSMGGLFSGKGGEDFAGEYIEPVDEVTGKVNVLMLGVDNEGLRTDTIIVASFDTDDSTVNLLSIPRDTRMYVGSRYQKINAAHAISKKNGKIAGPEGSIEAVTRLTGIPINYYVEFSFKAFRETIDALDGVYYNVPQNMNYEDPVQDLYIHLKQGYQLLDGDKAEQLVRFRSYPEGDIKRVRVQQDFIKAVADQKLNAGIIGKLPELYKTLSKNIKTNFTLADMTKYASPLMNLNLENMTTYELPGDYSGSEYEASYWLVNMSETKKLVETVFGYDTTYATIDKPAEGAVYGKTADPQKVAALKESTAPESSVTPSASPSASPKATASPTSKATAAPKKSASPSPSSKTDSTKETKEPEESKEPEKSEEPEKTEAPTPKPVPSFGSSSADGYIGGGDADFNLSDVHTPPTKPQSTPSSGKGGGMTPGSSSTPAPYTPPASTPASGGSTGFQRPSAN